MGKDGIHHQLQNIKLGVVKREDQVKESENKR